MELAGQRTTLLVTCKPANSRKASRIASRSIPSNLSKGEPMGRQGLQEASFGKHLQDLAYRWFFPRQGYRFGEGELGDVVERGGSGMGHGVGQGEKTGCDGNEKRKLEPRSNHEPHSRTAANPLNLGRCRSQAAQLRYPKVCPSSAHQER